MNQNLWICRFRSGILPFVLGICVCFSAPLARSATGASACSANAAARQLDFWVGDWTVTYPGMPGNASSKVQLSLDKCLVTESWDGGKGHGGENFFAYSADDKKWHGMFADNEGRVHVFEGQVTAGSAEFTGISRGDDGPTVLNRIKVIRKNTAKVEQSWEKSTDNGVTWTMVFHGDYSRRP
jgi:hypothetical protein